MPLYDYECVKCGEIVERFFKLFQKPDTLVCQCSGEMHSIVTVKAKPNVVNEYDETLEAYVTGPQHRRRLMRERGYEEL